MSLALVGTQTASATSLTAPAHQKGDLLLYWALRGASTTAPTLPAGIVSIGTESESTATSCSARLGFRIATGIGAITSASQNTSTGVWTTAANSLTAGQAVQITGTLPGGFAANTNYYVLAANLTSTTCELSATQGGAVKKPTSSASTTIDTDPSGTWTNASELICHVYRPSSGYTAGIGSFAVNKSTASTVNYPALTLCDTSGNSWVAGFVGAGNKTQTLTTAPSGMTNESSVVGSTYSAAGHDTEGGVSSWSSTNANAGSAGSTVSAVVEIMLLPTTYPAAIASHLYQHVKGGGNSGAAGHNATSPFEYKCPVNWASGSGNTLVFKFSCDSGVTVSSVNGTINGAMTSAVTAVGGASEVDTHTYYLQNITGGQELITVTFASVTNAFEYEITELYGVVTSGGTNGTASTAFSTTTATGSFTPGNNNTNGGNVVLAYFTAAQAAPLGLSSQIRSGPNLTALSADTGWNETDGDAFPKSAQIYVQAMSAAINPSITVVNQGTDNWNSIALAFAVSSGSGTAPPSSGIYMGGIAHYTTEAFPTSGVWRFQACATGKTRCIQCPDENIHTQIVTDSEGNTWQNDGTATPAFWYLLNAQPNPNLEIYCNGGGTDNNLSWRFYDLVQQNGTPTFDSAVDTADTIGSTQTVYTPTAKISPSNSNGLVIYGIGLGLGPGLAVTAPSGAVWYYCTYSGEIDQDLIENADIGAYYVNTATGAITATFTVTANAGNGSSGGIIAFAAGASSGAALAGTATEKNSAGAALSTSIAPTSGSRGLSTGKATATTAIKAAAGGHTKSVVTGAPTTVIAASSHAAGKSTANSSATTAIKPVSGSRRKSTALATLTTGNGAQAATGRSKSAATATATTAIAATAGGSSKSAGLSAPTTAIRLSSSVRAASKGASSLTTSARLVSHAASANAGRSAPTTQVRLVSAVRSVSTAGASFQNKAPGPSLGFGVSTALGGLTPWASVILASPLYTGQGSILGPHSAWSAGAPGVGDTVFYDPTNMVVQSNGEVVGTTNDFKAECMWMPSAGAESFLTVMVTSGFASWSQGASSGQGAPFTIIALGSSSQDVSAGAGFLIARSKIFGEASSKSAAIASGFITGIALRSSSGARSSGVGVPVTHLPLASQAHNSLAAGGTFGLGALFSSSSRGKSTSLGAPQTHISFIAFPKATSTGSSRLAFGAQFESAARAASSAAASIRTALELASVSYSISTSIPRTTIELVSRASSSRSTGRLSGITPARFGWAGVIALSQDGVQAVESAYVQNSSVYVQATYFDQNGDPFTPNAVSYRVDDLTSGLNIVPLTAIEPETTNIVNIPAADNYMVNATRNSEQHQALFEITDGFGNVSYERAVFDVLRVTGSE